MYICGKSHADGAYVEQSNPCAMCKRMIINSGIKDIYIRDTKDSYRHIMVDEYVKNDESLDGQMGY